jgi:hypothetical protein
LALTVALRVSEVVEVFAGAPVVTEGGSVVVKFKIEPSVSTLVAWAVASK